MLSSSSEGTQAGARGVPHQGADVVRVRLDSDLTVCGKVAVSGFGTQESGAQRDVTLRHAAC